MRRYARVRSRIENFHDEDAICDGSEGGEDGEADGREDGRHEMGMKRRLLMWMKRRQCGGLGEVGCPASCRWPFEDVNSTR